MIEQMLYIGGAWRAGDAAQSPVRSPWTGEIVTIAEGASPALVDAAIAAATAAPPLPAHQRSAVLRRVADEVRADTEPIAELITCETGKPIAAAQAEVARAVETLSMSADAARSITGESLDLSAQPGGEGLVAYTRPAPVGVVAAITPFNFPLNLACHKIGPAIAAGCPVVFKPSEKAPATGGRLVRAFHDAGLPPGHLNLVTGNPEAIVATLLSDERVAVISFTGSSAVGWSLKDRSLRKRHILELGSNTAMVVAGDADVPAAAAAAVTAGFANSGQACVSLQRAFVDHRILDEFLNELESRVKALVVGDPTDPRTDIGPLITPEAVRRVEASIREAVQAGGRVVLGGGRVAGQVLEPTILVDVPDHTRLAREELFGPVLSVTGVENLTEGIRRVNDSRFGLNTAIFTADLARALAFSERAEAGSVLVNVAPNFRSENMPYSGVKDSGGATEGVRYAVRNLLADKLVVVRSPGRPPDSDRGLPPQGSTTTTSGETP